MFRTSILSRLTSLTTNMRAFRFPQQCNWVLIFSRTRRHVIVKRRWPRDAASYPRRKKASTQVVFTNLDVRCYEMSYTSLLWRLSRIPSNCTPPLERANKFPTHKKEHHSYSCVLQKIPKHLQLSTYTSQKQTTWNMKEEFITAYYVLRQTALVRMMAEGNNRSQSYMRLHTAKGVSSRREIIREMLQSARNVDSTKVSLLSSRKLRRVRL